MTEPLFDDDVAAFLGTNHTASLATVGEAGRPHACNLWLAIDDRHRLYFVSSLESSHSRHILAEPAVAVTLYGDTDDPFHIHGLQLHGLCVPIASPPEGDEAQWQLAWDTYVGRFPFVEESELFRNAVLSQCFFRITPTWYRWLDSRKGFGFKYERRADRPAGAAAAGAGDEPGQTD